MGEPGPAVFAVGTRVMCFHNGLLNDAQVMDSAERQNSAGVMMMHYLIHYMGWSKNWDEWVDAERIRPMDEESIALKAELERAFDAKQARTAEHRVRGKGAKRAGEGDSKPGKKSKRGAQGTGSASVEAIKVVLPDELKLQLVDDWDKVARNGKIAKLRREVTIATVLKDFVTHIEPLGPRAASVASEVASGLKVYFNVHCGSTLLYDIERRQYKELREEFPDLDLTDAYGPEHLLRLFIKLPTLFARAGITAKGQCYITKCLEDLFEYLKANQKNIFRAGIYMLPSAVYTE